MADGRMRRLHERHGFELLVDSSVVIRINGHDVRVTGLDDFDSALRKHKGGETVPVVVIRDGKEVTLEVVLGPPR